MDPKSQSDLAPGAELNCPLAQATRSGSPSWSEKVAVRFIESPPLAKTFGMGFNVGKLLSFGVDKSGFVRAFSRLSRPLVEVMLPISVWSVRRSKLAGSRIASRASYAESLEFAWKIATRT